VPDHLAFPSHSSLFGFRGLFGFVFAFYADGMRGGGAAAIVAAVVSAIATFAVAVLPQLHFAYWQPVLHVALETAASLIALLACFLVIGRSRRVGQLGEVLLAGTLALYALLNLFLLVVPGLLPDPLVVAVALVGSSLGAVLFAFAALVPRSRLRRPGRALAETMAGMAMAMLVGTVVVSDLGERLRGAASPRPPEATGHLNLSAPPEVLALQLFMTLLFGLAAVGFVRRSQRFGDEFLGWLAIAGVVAAASHLNYFLYPALYSQWVHTGDVFRLCFYAVLLAGSIREIWSYWHALSRAAVLEERRRIARDLHDGLAQELAYLARGLEALEEETSGQLTRLRRAVERAQLESRRLVSMLAVPSGHVIETALAEAVSEIAERFHVRLDLDLAPGVQLPAPRAEALIRIACEAVTNAARHSGADRIGINLERDGPRVRLRVSDKGRGFDQALPGNGFGLVSMCERARSVGGELRVFSAPGCGSKVEAAL
jgi:signal transduction histidine kinase